MNVTAITASADRARALVDARQAGREEARRELLPLIEVIEDVFRRAKADADGSITVPMEDRLKVSIAVDKAKRRN